VQGFVITLHLRLRKNDRHIIIPVKANHVSFTANSRGCRCLKECTDPSKAYVGFVPGRLRAFPGPNIVDATEEQAILDILDNHPNRDAALGELEALENEMLAKLGGVYEDHTGPREDARELQRADYQRIRDVCGLDLTKELSFTQYKDHEQATAIVNIKAAYPWMTVLEAKAAIVKAVSGYRHEAVRTRTTTSLLSTTFLSVLALTASCL
jgi:hypothetical protein